MTYSLRFFDHHGDHPTITIVEHDTVEQALNAGKELGGNEWFWDSFCLGTHTEVTYMGMRGSLGIVNQEYFDGRFDG